MKRKNSCLLYPSFLFVLSLLQGTICFAQTDSLWQQKPVLTVSGFVDVFRAYDFNRPQGAYRQPFLYNHNRHNELNLNLGLLRGSVQHAKYRGSLALQAGTYANDNYAAEPQSLQSVFEASAGLSLNRKNSLWLDAGIFPSHIGFESAISLENWTLTRSLLAENSPYFLAGAKLSYSPNTSLDLVVLVVNGWQRIQRVEGSSLPSFGTQLAYRPADGISLNWSTFVGTDDPDVSRRMRYFNNLYGQFQLTERLGLITGFDTGVQQRSKHSTAYDLWLSPVAIVRYALSETWATALRGEYYQDKTAIIISTESNTPFNTTGLSLNLDYTPSENLAWRLEARWLKSREPLFAREARLVADNVSIVSSLAIRFGGGR
jgi:hypothetical protein